MGESKAPVFAEQSLQYVMNSRPFVKANSIHITFPSLISFPSLSSVMEKMPGNSLGCNIMEEPFVLVLYSMVFQLLCRLNCPRYGHEKLEYVNVRFSFLFLTELPLWLLPLPVSQHGQLLQHLHHRGLGPGTIQGGLETRGVPQHYQ